MGNFKIEIDAVGGHGDDRKAEAGDKLVFSEYESPDKLAYDFVQSLASRGMFRSGGGATLTHWPGDQSQVVDDLLSGVRLHGSFRHPKEDGDSIMQFFNFGHLAPELAAIARPYAEAARRLVHTLPRNAERTVALRKLLESKDAAVRALIAK